MIQRGIHRYYFYQRRTTATVAILCQRSQTSVPVPAVQVAVLQVAPAVGRSNSTTRHHQINCCSYANYYSSNVSSIGLKNTSTSTSSKNDNDNDNEPTTTNANNAEDNKNRWKAWFSSPEYQPTYCIPLINTNINTNINSRPITNDKNDTNNHRGGKQRNHTNNKSSSNSNSKRHELIIQLENIHLDNMAKSLLLLLQHVSNNFITTQEEQQLQYSGGGGGGGGGFGTKMYLSQEQRRQKVILEQYDYPTTTKCNLLLSTLLSNNNKVTVSSSSTLSSSSLSKSKSIAPSWSSKSSTKCISPSSKSQIAFQLFYLMNYVTNIKTRQNQNQNQEQNVAQLQQSSRPNYDTFFTALQLHSQENITIPSQQGQGQDHTMYYYYYSPIEEGEDILDLLDNNNNNKTKRIMKQTSIWSSTARRALYILYTMKQLEQSSNGSVLLDRIKVDVIIYNQVLAAIANSLLVTKASCCEVLLQEMISISATNNTNSSTMIDVSSYGYVFKACATTTDRNDIDDVHHYVDPGEIALRTWKSFESSELLRELIISSSSSSSSSSSLSNSPKNDGGEGSIGSAESNANDKGDNSDANNNDNFSMDQYGNAKNPFSGTTRGPQMIVYAMKSLSLIRRTNEKMVDEGGFKNGDGHRIDTKEICMKQFEIACQLGWINSHVLLAMDENLTSGIMHELLLDKYVEVTDSNGRNGGKEMTREEQYGQLFKRLPEEWKRNVDNVNQWGFNERKSLTT